MQDANNQFVLNCTIEANKAWYTTIIGCLSPKGQRVAIGSKLIEGTTAASCTAINDGTGSVRMHYSWSNGGRPITPVKETVATGIATKSDNSTHPGAS